MENYFENNVASNVPPCTLHRSKQISVDDIIPRHVSHPVLANNPHAHLFADTVNHHYYQLQEQRRIADFFANAKQPLATEGPTQQQPPSPSTTNPVEPRNDQERRAWKIKDRMMKRKLASVISAAGGQ